MSDRIYLGDNVENLDYGEQKIISKVVLTRSSDTWFEAGDDSGATLECSNPWATQAMANAILAAVQSAPAYMPFTAANALIDPAAEIGDMVTVGGIYGEIVSVDTTLDMMSSANLSAPGVDEVDDEYPYESEAEREAQRENKRIYSLIAKTDSEIKLMVANEIDGVQSQITQTANSLTAQISSVSGQVTTLSASLDSISAKVQDVEGNYSSLTIQVNGISSTVSNIRGSLSTVQQTVNGLEVTTNGLSSDINGLSNGTTLISGGCIRTGTISASRIDTANLVAENIGGGTVSLVSSYGSTVGNITIASSSSAISGQGVQINAPAIGIIATSGDVYAESRNGATYLHINTDLVHCKGSFVPNSSGFWNLGASTRKWANVYATNGTIQTSDRTQKTDISYDMSRYDALFDALKPCTYRMADGGQRTHAGLISQDVEEELGASGLTDMDFAGFIRSPNSAGNGYDYALRYAEFVPLLIYQEQRSKTRIAELEARVAVLEAS